MLSSSFGSICKKITLDNNKKYVVKITNKLIDDFDSVYFEGKSLDFLNYRFPDLFPKVFKIKPGLIIIEYIDHNNKKKSNSEKELAIKLANIHLIKNSKFGFIFDSPIGGLRQPNELEDNWVNFFLKKRLNIIFEIINYNNPMPLELNKKIEKIFNKIADIIPNKPKASLIHGDLWEGNILFDDGKLVGLIDPGVHYAHNEMEIAYLKWFNYISENFYNYYSDIIPINKEFFEYSEIYELYYCLLNIHLWSRKYIDNAMFLVNKYC